MSFFAPDPEFFERVQIKPARRIAFVGKRDGTITSDREHYIYVRANSLVGPEYQVYDPGKLAPRIPGVVVEVVEREGAAGRFEVKGFAGSTPDSVIAKTTGSAAQQYGGPDQQIIDQRQLKQGTMHQTNPASMTVTINAFTIEEGPTRHSVPTQTTGTITAPGAGLARWDTVSIDPFDFSLTVTTGATYNKNFPEAGVKPAHPTSELFFGNITLNDGTTSLRDGRNISPAPPYFQMPDNLITAISSSINTSGPGAYEVDTSGGAITLTLDTDDAVAGRRIVVKDVTGDAATNNITIATEGAETIDEAATITIDDNHGFAGMYDDGTDWWTTSKSGGKIRTEGNFDLFIERNQRQLDENWLGSFHTLSTADALNSGSPITLTGASGVGIGKVIIAVLAGSDFAGEITVTGTSVDRNTGATTPVDTDTITVDVLTTDGSDTDAQGDVRHSFTNAYITSKWFDGDAADVVLSTTDLTLTDVDTYQGSFEQFNDKPDIILRTFNASLIANNSAAVFHSYLYSVEVTGDKVDITRQASLEQPTAAAGKAYRKRVGNIDVDLNGNMDGIWVDIFFRPDTQNYWDDISMQVWYTALNTVTLT